MTRLRLSVAIPLAALALAGCGGDDKPSKEDFAKSAEAICADLEKQSDELSKAEPKSVEDVAQFATKAKTTAEDAVKRIRDVELPEGADGDKAKEWQDAVSSEAEDQLIPALDELKAAADANDEQALVAAAQKIEALESTKSDALAKEIGADGCAD
jgi:hypothetical protein